MAFLGTKSRRPLEGSERRARREQENQLWQKHQEQEGKPFSFRSLLMPLTPGTCRCHTRAEPWEELGTKEPGCPHPQPLPPRQQALWHLFEGFGDRREASEYRLGLESGGHNSTPPPVATTSLFLASRPPWASVASSIKRGKTELHAKIPCRV